MLQLVLYVSTPYQFDLLFSNYSKVFLTFPVRTALQSLKKMNIHSYLIIYPKAKFINNSSVNVVY